MHYLSKTLNFAVHSFYIVSSVGGTLCMAKLKMRVHMCRRGLKIVNRDKTSK
jgi:hypothetical protein